MNITILGAGAMGSALAIPLSERGHNIRLWFTKYDIQIYEEVSRGKPHPRIRVVLPSKVRLYKPDELREALSGTDIIVIAVSSQGVLPISKLIRETIGNIRLPIIIVSKGIEIVNGKTMTMSEIVLRYTGNDKIVYVGGPSLAAELASRKPTFVVYASRHTDMAKKISLEFETEYYRINVIDDITGVEISAALKNIYAMAYGIVEGYLEVNKLFNNNLKAAILTKSLHELASIVVLCGGRKETVYGLAGLGDLYVTSLGGRNSMFGRLLGSGLPVDKALEEMRRRGVGVVEGYRNADTIKKFLEEKGLARDKAPIFYSIYSILYEGGSVDVLFKSLK